MAGKAEMVKERFSQVNCAQTVFSLFAEDLGIDENLALKIASGFGGGMACAETCGAVTGAYMVIGIKHGHSEPDAEAKAKTKSMIQKFNSGFKNEHGSLICKKLTGYDISIPEEADKAREVGVFEKECPVFIQTACNILEKDF